LIETNALTSLPNRISFNEATNKALLQAGRNNTMLALLLIDMDHFQELKQAHGPTVTHGLLEELSKRFRALLRASDTLAHLENDEFALLLTDLEQTKLIGLVAEKLLKACAEPFKLNSEEVLLTASIGISTFPNDGQTLEELQKKVADALYQAKKQGGNNYQFTLPQMTLEAHHFMKLQAALREALNNNEFRMYYQPKLDLKTWGLSGVEALIRWEHPTYGLIDPLKFIPSAEETGLILQIGEWTLREACRASMAWQNKGYQPISVAVNLSPKQLYQPELIKIVKAVLNESALDPRYLDLEIAEMTVMDDTEKVNHILHGLKNLGVTLSVDDFGIGHTSISYLRDFPINTVKIDQSFIKSLPLDPKNAAITTAIITLAHQLGIKVVAEGVETMEQVKFLADQHCDQVQGYFISRPLPAAKIVAQMTRIK